MNEIARELVKLAKDVTAESKGTIESGMNGSLTLRKLFGTAKIRELSELARKTADMFLSDVKSVIDGLGFDTPIDDDEPEISGFSQGGYIQYYVSVGKRGDELWAIMEGLRKLGYRIK